jgi:hypothetical protein
MDIKQQSAAECDLAIDGVQVAHNQLGKAETSAAIKTIRHCMVHGGAEFCAKLTDKLGDYGSKGAKTAYNKLVMDFSGASMKDGTANIDKTRQEKARPIFEAELVKVEMLGLTDWYFDYTGKEKNPPKKTEAEKQAAAITKAYKAFEKMAADDSNPIAQLRAKAMLEYGAGIAELATENYDQAKQQLAGDMAHLKTGLATALNHIKAA